MGVPHVQEISQVYQSCGVSLGHYKRLRQGMQVEPGWAVGVPPGTPLLEKLHREVRIAVTGWAADPRTKYRLRADHAIPLSDHADYSELLEAGHDAQLLGRRSQGRLFWLRQVFGCRRPG
ncbi:MAG TPA: hypothetical protein VE890_13555 [Thermoguttaceae bacterium]|nr:hypothetical protein [Thermoguttaceae bacterium]